MTVQQMAVSHIPVSYTHLESTYTIRNNAYSFGCTFADVTVDIPTVSYTHLDVYKRQPCIPATRSSPTAKSAAYPAVCM